MAADHRGESGQQRTVAELLKQYGGEDASGNGRRRRRAPDLDDPPADPPIQPPTQRPEAALPDLSGVNGTGGYRVNGIGGFESQDYRRPEAPSTFDPGSGTGWSGAPDLGPPTLSGADSFGGPAYRSDIYQSGGAAPPGAPRARSESTDFIPRYDELPAGPSGRSRGEMFHDDDDMAGPGTTVSSRAEMFDDDDDLAGPGTTVSSRADLFGDDDDPRDEHDEEHYGPDSSRDEAPNGFLGRRLRRSRAATEPADTEEPAADLFTARGKPKTALATDDVPAGLAPEDDAAEVEREGKASSAKLAKLWLLLVVQLVLGAVLGAALWVGFSYLWRNFPVMALAAAVLTTAGLVLLVRSIRRSDDLQTTMLALLVGLVVTISPAVLLLAER